MSSWFDSEEKQEIERLKRAVSSARFEDEQRRIREANLRAERQNNRFEAQLAKDEENEELQDRLGKIEKFLQKKYLEEWDSFKGDKHC